MTLWLLNPPEPSATLTESGLDPKNSAVDRIRINHFAGDATAIPPAWVLDFQPNLVWGGLGSPNTNGGGFNDTGGSGGSTDLGYPNFSDPLVPNSGEHVLYYAPIKTRVVPDSLNGLDFADQKMRENWEWFFADITVLAWTSAIVEKSFVLNGVEQTYNIADPRQSGWWLAFGVGHQAFQQTGYSPDYGWSLWYGRWPRDIAVISNAAPDRDAGFFHQGMDANLPIYWSPDFNSRLSKFNPLSENSFDVVRLVSDLGGDFSLESSVDDVVLTDPTFLNTIENKPDNAMTTFATPMAIRPNWTGPT